MPDFEEVCERLFEDPQWARKVLLGGLIAFVPVLNIVAMGYLLRFQTQARQRADFRLPDWSRWDELFIDGLRFLGVHLLFFWLPISLGALASWLFRGFSVAMLQLMGVLPRTVAMQTEVAGDIGESGAAVDLTGTLAVSGGLGYFGPVTQAPLSLAYLFAPAVFAVALFIFSERKQFKDLLDLLLVLRLLHAARWRLILPSLVFAGLTLTLLPVYGFGFFLGFLSMIAYSTVLFMLFQQQHDHT